MIRHPIVMNRLRPLPPLEERRDCDSCVAQNEPEDSPRCQSCKWDSVAKGFSNWESDQ